jgi:hypothetical protein
MSLVSLNADHAAKYSLHADGMKMLLPQLEVTLLANNFPCAAVTIKLCHTSVMTVTNRLDEGTTLIDIRWVMEA